MTPNQKLIIFAIPASPCKLRPYRTGLVCVCNATYCDTLEFLLPSAKGAFLVVSTSEQGLRFQQTTGKFNTEATTIHDRKHQYLFSSQRLERSSKNVFDSRSIIDWLTENYSSSRQSAVPNTLEDVTVTIDPSIKYQKIVGFGGALTGSVAHLLQNMSPELRKQVLEAYFSKEKGIGYSMIRTSIGGCDFDLEPWAYNEVPQHDAELSNFTQLDGRDLLKVELLNKIQRIAGDDRIKIVATAWSPPKWMKYEVAS